VKAQWHVGSLARAEVRTQLFRKSVQTFTAKAVYLKK
jgi:hypothetical protein